jgi:multisubunit Na+/H+ antiporter MnhF subunit
VSRSPRRSRSASGFGHSAFLDIALGISLVGFLAAVAVARLVEAHARSGTSDG